MTDACHLWARTICAPSANQSIRPPSTQTTRTRRNLHRLEQDSTCPNSTSAAKERPWLRPSGVGTSRLQQKGATTIIG